MTPQPADTAIEECPVPQEESTSDRTTRCATFCATPSSLVVKVLATAVRRAVRLGFPFVGTENLLIALSGENGPGHVFSRGALRADALARGTDHWADDDSAPDSASDIGVTALLREAEHRVRAGEAPPESGALRECLRAAIADAGDGVLTTAHLALALLRAPSGRAAELLTVHRVDIQAAITAARAAAEPEDTPAVWLLRKAGALEERSGGGWAHWVIRLLARDDVGGPVLLAVRNEAGRLAARVGRSKPAAVDLMAAVLTLDDQLTTSGRHLRREYRSGAAEALRAAGVAPSALLGAATRPSDGELERAWAGARLMAARRGDDVVRATHLLLALLDDPADPLGPALHGLGVDPAALRETVVRPTGHGR